MYSASSHPLFSPPPPPFCSYSAAVEQAGQGRLGRAGQARRRVFLSLCQPQPYGQVGVYMFSLRK